MLVRRENIFSNQASITEEREDIGRFIHPRIAYLHSSKP
jgi:hypothetical protein